MHQIWKNKWEKIGLILEPNHEIYWMKSHTSSPFVVNDKGKLSFFFTARDSQNRSRIGQGNLSKASNSFCQSIGLALIIGFIISILGIIFGSSILISINEDRNTLILSNQCA